MGLFLGYKFYEVSSYPMDNRGSFLGGKAAGGVNLTTHLHLVPRSKNEWSYTSTPQYSFMAWCSVKETFYFLKIWSEVTGYKSLA
jgi:diadenosine tetraphosphate (Ap4A) HIT family hydrolase